jgi:hypothetical protein
MCTISLVASPDGAALRILLNRDERRLRRVARPPAVHQTGLGHAVWPTDPEGGGTWVAATHSGLALMVLNIGGHPCPAGLLSRGLVIPMLACARSLDDVLARWERLDISAFAPFRLLAVTRGQLAVCDGAPSRPIPTRVGRAHVFASSSLGDAEAQLARGELFARMLRMDIDPWSAQTRFHQHAWPDRRHISVMMSRVDACTVSQTEVLLTHASVSLAYRPVVDGWPMAETRRALPITAASRAA